MKDNKLEGSPIIELPKDPVRVEQLRLKLEEYTRRMREDRWTLREKIETLIRILLLDKLFHEGRVRTWAFVEELREAFGVYPERAMLQQSCIIIQDYCKTGGTTPGVVIGGTGLEKAKVH